MPHSQPLELELRDNRDAAPELIDRENDLPTIRGRAITYNVVSEPMLLRDKTGKVRRFREVILPGALDDTLRLHPDIKALGDHLFYRVLGRTKNGTLRLFPTAEGLDVEIDPPPTTIGKDAVISIRRGDVDGMSFGFAPVVSEWTEADDGSGELRHTIAKLRLGEVTITAFPAYTETTLSTRSADALEEFLARSSAEPAAAERPVDDTPQATPPEPPAAAEDLDQVDVEQHRAAARTRELELASLAFSV